MKKIRMKQLSAQSGFAASAIRFYIKERILRDPERPTPNSALYTQEHLNDLSVVAQIKALAPELPLAQLRRVMELVRQGVEPEIAISLHRSVNAHASQAGTGTDEPMTRSDFIDRAGIDESLLAQLLSLRIVVPVEGSDQFDQADLQVAVAVSQLLSLLPEGLSVVGKVASHIEQASAIEMSMRNAISGAMSDQHAAELSQQMQDWGNFWHAYLFARFRIAEIARFGLGNEGQPAAQT